MKKSFGELALKMHAENQGKLGIFSKVKIETKDDLSIAYTPGVAQPCLEIARDEELVYKYTAKGNMVAIVTDGSAVLGLGNIGAKAAIPVMEGKAILFKNFADVDAFPICLATQDVDEIVNIVEKIAPMFGGINLEDISAPRCFEIEERLKAKLNIPVFHDDQHGTAIAVLSGLINALKVTTRRKETSRVVISGVGAAGVAIANILVNYGFGDVVSVDSRGIIVKSRTDLNPVKQKLLLTTNPQNLAGDLAIAMKGADIFIGVSAPDVLSAEMVKTMNVDPIIFAMANPKSEIDPELAKSAGAKVVATGRSDYPNQVNNVLVFPGLFRGLLDARITKITEEMKIVTAEAIANSISDISPEKIIPPALDKAVANVVAKAIIDYNKKL